MGKVKGMNFTQPSLKRKKTKVPVLTDNELLNLDHGEEIEENIMKKSLFLLKNCTGKKYPIDPKKFFQSNIFRVNDVQVLR